MISNMTGSIDREVTPCQGTAQGKRGLLVVPRGRADLRNHGATYRDPWWQHAGYTLLGRWKWIPTERHGPDVFADERLPFAALAEARLQSAKRRPLDLGGINE
jgi:hypothetical protein